MERGDDGWRGVCAGVCVVRYIVGAEGVEGGGFGGVGEIEGGEGSMIGKVGGTLRSGGRQYGVNGSWGRAGVR